MEREWKDFAVLLGGIDKYTTIVVSGENIDENLLFWDSIQNVYLKSFPLAEQDRPSDIVQWLKSAHVQDEYGKKLHGIYIVLVRDGKACGMCYVDCFIDHHSVIGSFFAIAKGHRKIGQAKLLYTALKTEILRVMPEAIGIILEVDYPNFHRLDENLKLEVRKLTGPKNVAAGVSLSRVIAYTRLANAKCLYDSKGNLYTFRQPDTQGGTSSKEEVELAILVIPLTKLDEKVHPHEIIEFMYHEYYRISFRDSCLAGADKYDKYVERLLTSTIANLGVKPAFRHLKTAPYWKKYKHLIQTLRKF